MKTLNQNDIGRVSGEIDTLGAFGAGLQGAATFGAAVPLLAYFLVLQLLSVSEAQA